MGFWNCFRICGGLAPVLKTDIMTQPVGVGQDGKLWTEPVGGGGGTGDETTKVYYQVPSTELINHYMLTVDDGFVPEVIDMVFKNGNTYTNCHMVRCNENYYTQGGLFVDNAGNTYVVYNGSGDNTKVFIEDDFNSAWGTPVGAVTLAKRIV